MGVYIDKCDGTGRKSISLLLLVDKVVRTKYKNNPDMINIIGNNLLVEIINKQKYDDISISADLGYEEKYPLIIFRSFNTEHTKTIMITCINLIKEYQYYKTNYNITTLINNDEYYFSGDEFNDLYTEDLCIKSRIVLDSKDENSIHKLYLVDYVYYNIEEPDNSSKGKIHEFIHENIAYIIFIIYIIIAIIAINLALFMIS